MQATTRKLVLLSEEPAGLIPTRTPGAVRFEATLTWKSGEDAVTGKILPSWPASESVNVSAKESNGNDAVRRISGEVRAFVEEDMRNTLDPILSTITSTAATSEAVLEMRCFRLARPHVVPQTTLESLALGLWGAGWGVRFGTCWTPLRAGEEAAVGIRGAERGAEYARELIKDFGLWEVASSSL